MTADKAFIDYLRKRYKLTIPDDLEDYLIEEYGEEPFPNVYSEQDLYEQIRKLEMKYHKGNLDVTLKGATLRMKQKYEALQDEYLIVMNKVRSLEDEVSKLKALLLEHGVDILYEEQF